nr:hypothetical protein [uncultured Microbacterium sp.]
MVVPDDDENWVVGCGGDSLGVGGLAGDFTVEPDGGLPPDGAAAISKNVYAG